jgi:hypothetical protein
MKPILVLALSSLFFGAQLAQAAALPVYVQCSPLGPRYDGTLETNLNFTEWEIEGRCEVLQISGSAIDHLKLRIPFLLKFNNLEYRPKELVTDWYGTTSTNTPCDRKNLTLQLNSFHLVETRTGYSFGDRPHNFSPENEPNVKNGQIPNIFEFWNEHGSCVIVIR